METAGSAPSKVTFKEPVPSGLTVMLPLLPLGVCRVRASPSMAKVPEVDCRVGEAEPKTMSPALFMMMTVFSTAEAEAGYPWRVSVFKA